MICFLGRLNPWRESQQHILGFSSPDCLMARGQGPFLNVPLQQLFVWCYCIINIICMLATSKCYFCNVHIEAECTGACSSRPPLCPSHRTKRFYALRLKWACMHHNVVAILLSKLLLEAETWRSDCE
jgi:hypothetical protein